MHLNEMKAIAETERLFLRTILRNDVAALAEIFTDAEAMRYIAEAKDIDSIKEWISLVQKSYEHYGYGPWAVINKSTHQFLGYCGLYLQEDVNGNDEVEILYGLTRKNWEKGFATEAAKAVYELGSGKFNLKRFVSLIDPDNVRSINVAEKIGMTWHNKTYRWGRLYRVYFTEI